MGWGVDGGFVKSSAYDLEDKVGGGRGVFVKSSA